MYPVFDPSCTLLPSQPVMTPEEVRGKAVTVVGGARSGRSASRLLATAGARPFLTERGALAPGLEEELDDLGVSYEAGGHTDRALRADFLVVSPGVPSTASLLQRAQALGVPVYAEIEVASWFCRAPIVAVTGTNGKTTTTRLLGHIFRTAGREPVVAGNIGTPFSAHARTVRPDQVVVLEVSSFQLDHVDAFRPRASVLLNITPDHLDRYGGSFDAYADSKYRIFSNQASGDALVYNADDDRVRERVGRLRPDGSPRALAISLHHEVDTGAFVRDDALVLRLHHEEDVLMYIEELALRGRHNLYNSLAAAVAARVMEVRSDVVRESLGSFEGVPHRLEAVRTLDGVQYVNDSKATNVNAVWYALESFHEPIVLIAGGRDKGNDYTMLQSLVRDRVRAVIALGESADIVRRDLGAAAPHCEKAASMRDAVDRARRLARRGDVVLLSPACASFDMFENFEDRGDTFRRIVQKL